MPLAVTILTILHAFISFCLIVVVLLQFGKGAELGATMGGASQSIFSSSQKGNILTKITAAFVLFFLVNSIVLSIAGNKLITNSSLDSEAPVAAPLDSGAVNLNQEQGQGQPSQNEAPTPAPAK